MIEDQAAFDKAVDHLLTQGKPSVDADGHCMYRAPDGCMCGAGPFIPDALYQPAMEGKKAWSILDMWPALREFFPERGLTDRIQTAHDDAAQPGADFLAELRPALIAIAADHRLNLPPALAH